MTSVKALGPHTYTEAKLPLPGLYPVVTWQLNVTMHQASGLSKFVSVIREPSDHYEIRRDFGDLSAWQMTRGHLLLLLGEIPDALAHMVGAKVS
jgi:hypothetical protein